MIDSCSASSGSVLTESSRLDLQGVERSRASARDTAFSSGLKVQSSGALGP